MWDVEGEDEDAVKQKKITGAHQKYLLSHERWLPAADSGLLTAEAVTLAQQLVNRQTTRTHLINDGFSRYTLNAKDDLPPWFLDDESQHYRPNIPITKEAVAALRAKQRALDARPIKKIAEAKARKKFKASQRLEKAMKKAQGVTEAGDLSEREKAQQIVKLMRKGNSTGKKRKETKVVVAKGAHKGVQGRPKGVKGRYQMVDARMRKENRAKKRVEKANKKRKRNWLCPLSCSHSHGVLYVEEMCRCISAICTTLRRESKRRIISKYARPLKAQTRRGRTVPTPSR
jgi:AdoMet-dependent rRNA methyltransferase SPB1